LFVFKDLTSISFRSFLAHELAAGLGGRADWETGFDHRRTIADISEIVNYFRRRSDL